MKTVKPVKVPILTRVVERNRLPELHVATMLGFPLSATRALADEVAFWAVVQSQLGEQGMLDESCCKMRGELLVAGSFFAPGGAPMTASFARVKVGELDKRVAVLGDREWHNGVPTPPQPIIRMPIDWAHAFGGPSYERNPHGLGAAPIERDGRWLHPLPNIEHYGRLVRSPSETPLPAGFGPMDVRFAQRRERAGTFDRRWLDEHFPGLPADVTPTFFNLASDDQWLDGFWSGDEELLAEHMHPELPIQVGRLPGLRTRVFAVQPQDGQERFIELPMRCDTVWLFPSVSFGVLVSHGRLVVRDDDAADVTRLLVACETLHESRPAEHYRQALGRRLDKDQGALAALSDSDLMPEKTSGVAPNIGPMDVERWVKGENLLAHRGQRGAERRYAEARARVAADGLNPDDYGLATPPQPAILALPEDPDDLVTFVAEQVRKADEVKAKGEEQQARAIERARALYAEQGQDYDLEVEAARASAGGPPKFRPRAHNELMLAEVNAAIASGVPLEALAAHLADPAHLAQLDAQDHQMREQYRASAHLRFPATPMPSEASARARVIAQAAIDSGESLAERDFTGVDWSNMRLPGLDLRGALLEASNLEGCDLSGAKLDRAVLAKARMKGAKLTGASLRGANLGASNLHGASLDGADLSEAILARAELDGASFRDTRLDGADFLLTKFGNVDLSGATLPRANVLNADLRGARFVGADLSGANLIECQLDGADFSRALMAKTTFIGCQGEEVCFREARFEQGIMVHGSAFSKADFADAKMPKANLRGTVLTHARIDRADLTGADLSECDATGASLVRTVLVGALAIRTVLRDASLRGANLMDALLSKAQLQGADLAGSNLARSDLSRVLADERTKLTDAEVAQVRFLPKALPPPGGAP